MTEAPSTREAHLAAWVEFTSGLALLYLGPSGTGDEYTYRVIVAHQTRDLDEMEHVSALLLVRLLGRGWSHAPDAWLAVVQEWKRLSEAYHAQFCPACRRDLVESVTPPSVPEA